MADSHVVSLNKPEETNPLQKVLREGARKMLAAVIEAEVAVFIKRHGALKNRKGQRAVVRYGYLPERTI